MPVAGPGCGTDPPSSSSSEYSRARPGSGRVGSRAGGDTASRDATHAPPPRPGGSGVEQHAVDGERLAGDLVELLDEVAHLQEHFCSCAEIEHDATGVHHDQPVAEAQRQLHVVRDHQRREAALGDDRRR